MGWKTVTARIREREFTELMKKLPEGMSANQFVTRLIPHLVMREGIVEVLVEKIKKNSNVTLKKIDVTKETVDNTPKL